MECSKIRKRLFDIVFIYIKHVFGGVNYRAGFIYISTSISKPISKAILLYNGYKLYKTAHEIQHLMMGFLFVTLDGVKFFFLTPMQQKRTF